MILETSKGRFHVVFNHYNSKDNDPDSQRSIRRFHREFRPNRKIVGTTECYICTVPNSVFGDKVRKCRPAFGITGRTIMDPFSSVVGERNSLARAIEAAEKFSPIFGCKDFRQEIWKAYFSTLNKES